jgi:ABC-2 type transport system ATP-binding protein
VRELRPGDYLVDTAATPTLVAALTAWLRDQGALVSELRAGRRSLEDVFLRLTGEGRS